MKRRRVFFIVNPSAGGGFAMRRWPHLSDYIHRQLGDFEYEYTNSKGVATMLADEAIKKGYDMIVPVGGDGTINEVINGMLVDGRPKVPDIILGIIPVGAGSDFARTLKLSHDECELVRVLKEGEIRSVDVGMVNLIGHDGRRKTEYFLNMADVGIGGEVARRANAMPKYMGGFLTFLSSTIFSVMRFRPRRVRIQINDGGEEERIITTIFIANGQYFGGGMWIASRAKIDDGLFDVFVAGPLSKMELLSVIPRLYTGSLSSVKGVEYFRASKLKISSGEEVLVNCDGEQPGLTPAEFTVLPRVLKIRC